MKKIFINKLMLSAIICFLLIGTFVISVKGEQARAQTRGYERNEYYSKDAYCNVGGCDITPGQNEWMKKIDDNRFLQQLSIPGTHDSMAHTLKENIVGMWQQTKSKTLTQSMLLHRQLMMGIRYVDMRLVLKDNKLAMYHGSVFLDNYFDNALDDVSKFLKDNPSEVIFMRIRKEHNGNDATDFSNRLYNQYYNSSKYGHLFYKGELENYTPIKDVRGKIVIFKNFPQHSRFSGYILSHQFEQDFFELGTEPFYGGLHHKLTLVKNFLHEASQKTPTASRFYLGHLSGTGDGTMDYMYPWTVASGFTSKDSYVFDNVPNEPSKYFNFPVINGQRKAIGTNIAAYQEIREKHLRNIGIVIMDFPGSGLVDAIIEANEFKYNWDAYCIYYYNYDAPDARDIPDHDLNYKRRGEVANLSSLIPRATGKKFIGWEYRYSDFAYSGIKKIFQPGEKIEMYAFANLFAKWETVTTKYHIEYQNSDIKGITNNMPSGSYYLPYNDIYRISSTQPTNDGYKFNHWDGSDGKKYYPGQRIDVEKTLTLTANWTYVGLDLEYKSNLPNTTNLPKKNTGLALLTNVTISPIKPTSPGYIFRNWIVEGKDVILKPGDSYYMTYYNSNLIAQWDNKLYKVSYLSSDDTIDIPVDSSTYQYNDLVTINSKIPKRQGWIFNGWQYNNKIYNPGSKLEILDDHEDIQLHARWTLDDGVSVDLKDSVESAPGIWIYIGD